MFFVRILMRRRARVNEQVFQVHGPGGRRPPPAGAAGRGSGRGLRGAGMRYDCGEGIRRRGAMPFNLGGPELIIVLVIVLIVFGAGKLPSVMRDVGKGVKEFKNAQTEEEPVSQTQATTS